MSSSQAGFDRLWATGDMVDRIVGLVYVEIGPLLDVIVDAVERDLATA